MIYEFENNQCDIPPLREPLSEVLPHREAVEAFKVGHALEEIGEKIMVLSARRLQHAGDRPSLILVAIADVTERRRSRWLLEHHDPRYGYFGLTQLTALLAPVLCAVWQRSERSAQANDVRPPEP